LDRFPGELSCLLHLLIGLGCGKVDHDGRLAQVATRYDRCPKAFLSAVALAATVMFWL